MDVLAVPADRQKGWYLSLMAPNTKGPEYAWLDPSRLYCNSQVRLLPPLLEKVSCPFEKWVTCSSQPKTKTTQTTQAEKRLWNGAEDPFGHVGSAAGVRVLLVDQWIETGGTMRAAIQLVEKLGATVVGVAAVAIENNEGGKWIKENYKFSHCIPEALQSQVDGKHLNFFESFNK
uniref:Zgc:174895 n=1 Tax=Fundulus heteroclitus TaxID=8078 RepID=A0A3Q2PGQ7_FUNHE